MFVVLKSIVYYYYYYYHALQLAVSIVVPKHSISIRALSSLSGNTGLLGYFFIKIFFCQQAQK